MQIQWFLIGQSSLKTIKTIESKSIPSWKMSNAAVLNNITTVAVCGHKYVFGLTQAHSKEV